MQEGKMNAEMRVLQALDAAQSAFQQMRGLVGEERARVAEAALHTVIAAPWSMITRPEEADQHGWLSQMREALRALQDDPEGEGAGRRIEEGLWAASELERDMRGLIGAR